MSEQGHPDGIPIVDISALRAGGPELTRLAHDVGQLCEQVGFLVVVGHGVDPADVAAIDAVAREFFHLPLAEKLISRSPLPDVYRGYTPSEASALAATYGLDTPPDLCELFTVNRFDDPVTAVRSGLRPGREGFFAPNVWPARPAALRPVLERWYGVMEQLALDLMGLFALALGQPQGFFAPFFDEHITNLTLNYYPPQERPPAPGQLRRGPHTDWGSLTILYQDDSPGGLEVRTRSGEWVPVPYVPESFVVNLGDLMAFWTADRWVSNVHRVLNPTGPAAMRERLSVAFFHQPMFDAVIRPIAAAAGSDEAGLPETTSGEWILEKLRISTLSDPEAAP